MKLKTLFWALTTTAGIVWSCSSAAGSQVLQANAPKIISQLQAIGELPKTQRLNIVIGLPLRNQQALADFLHQLYDPTSPQYHEYLTPDQFTEKFGPTAADYQTLMNFAQAAGLKVTRTHRNRTLIDVRGSVADVEKLFHVTLRTYNHPT